LARRPAPPPARANRWSKSLIVISCGGCGVTNTSPSGHTYVTTPGSALLFPSLCAPTGDLPEPDPPAPTERCGDRTAMMPTRQRTRAQHRADAITAERHHNQQTREASDALYFGGAPPPTDDDEPPPF
jgi:hypothetical protein